MSDAVEWARDPELMRLREEFVEAYAKWCEVRPDPARLHYEMAREQLDAMHAAMDAEKRYDARRRDLGLLSS